MKVLVILMMLAIGAMALPSQKPGRIAEVCDDTKCLLPNCKCSNTDIPGGLDVDETPQFVLLSFDDAVTPNNIENYRSAVYGRTNPNGCVVSATFFVSHEYTDYTLVHDLHANGQEIGLHSISHQVSNSYWLNSTLALLLQEFADERSLINAFANIPEEDMKGIRMPTVLAGNNQFNMLKQSGFLYDYSWATQNNIEPGLWPYTTDYLSTQDCDSSDACPTESFPGVWVIPVISWKDLGDIVCSTVDACVDIPEDTKEITNWMIREFERQYKGNRAPVSIHLTGAWFAISQTHLDAYTGFLDYLKTLPDVYMVSASQLIDWVRNPIPVSEMKSEENINCPEIDPTTCNPKSCQLMKGTEERWMTSCVANCPKSYPWLGNPYGSQ